MASTKKKAASALAAVGVAAALALGGTFAWQSISQTALNEASDVVNPGGRLHDDFNGTNKDVYVENFTDEETGEPIYARIRLSEYMGMVFNKGTDVESLSNLVGGATWNGEDDKVEVTEYELFTGYGGLDENGSVAAAVDGDGTAWWTWQTGGQTVYLPTFNKNKDSLAADLNGTYIDAVGGISNRDGNQYSGYVEYTEGAMLEGTEVWDADANDVEDEYVTEIAATHTAKMTGTATLISMADWLAMNNVSVASASGDDPYGVSPAFAANGPAVLRYDKNAEDATGSIDDVSEPYGTLLALSDGTGFSREGYTLVGWNTQSDGSGTDYALGAAGWELPEGETTLYAVWQLNRGSAESQEGYWVYDTDGWVYWSQPIAPGTATGLLLDSIELNQVMDDTWYYAIDVEAQFVTADDVGKSDGTGFYVEGTEPSAEAEALLKTIGVEIDEGTAVSITATVDGVDIYDEDTGDSLAIQGDVVLFSAEVLGLDDSSIIWGVDYDPDELTLEQSESDGMLSLKATEVEWSWTPTKVTATASDGVTATYELYFNPKYGGDTFVGLYIKADDGTYSGGYSNYTIEAGDTTQYAVRATTRDENYTRVDLDVDGGVAWSYGSSTPADDDPSDSVLLFTVPTADEMGADAIWVYTATAYDGDGVAIGSSGFVVYNPSVVAKVGFSGGVNGYDFQMFQDAVKTESYYALMLNPDYGKVYNTGLVSNASTVANAFYDGTASYEEAALSVVIQ